jgi:glycosyltransferase involved in cell wall biosynthesis
MKIAIVSTFYPLRGGIAQFNALIFRELEKNHKVKAFTFKRQYPSLLFPGKTQYVSSEDNADKIPSTEILDTINPFTYLKTANKVKEFHPDLILTKYWMTFFAPSLGYVLSKNKKAIRISILDNVIPHEKRFFDTPFNRYFLKQNDGFIVMSDKVLNDLLSIVPNAKYLRINHPIYNHFGAIQNKIVAQKKLNIDATKKTILFFGIIRDYKGLDLLIEALSFLDDSFQLVIAGEVYGSFDKYSIQINKLMLENRIYLFNQYISDDEVSTFFSAVDVCVLPYKSATQSGITSIANHFLVPLIATDVGGLKETIEHEKTGLIVEKPDSKLIANSISHYFKNNNKENFSNNIQIQNEENSWEKFCAKIEHFYKELTLLNKNKY